MTSMRKSLGLRLQTSIVQDNIPVEIAEGLFVGSIHTAFNVEELKANKITHVLNLAGSYATFPEDFTYLSLNIRDKEYASLLSCLPIAAVFIDSGLRHGKVLVHCAGGRSRSPAVIMAFLMMKQQASYLAISTHVKILRPVVSLNAGFDAQLKCLERANGDVFIANQYLLKERLARLARQYQDGELTCEMAKTCRQFQKQASQSSPPPLFKKQSSIEMVAAGCDDRGMVGGVVPCGFYLSIPTQIRIAGTATASSFIPALRSMGTMFGCQSCGESLFCAGAIVHQHETDKGDSVRFLDVLRGRVCSSQADVVTTAKEGPTKKPLLAKLRLRPQSPVAASGNTAKNVSDNVQNGTALAKTPQILQAPRRSVTEEIISISTVKSNEEVTAKSKSTIEGMWRSLTSFKTSKRAARSALHDVKSGEPSRTGSLQLQRSTFAVESKSSSVGRTAEHLAFLKRNVAEWRQNIEQLANINKDPSEVKTHTAMVDQMTALLNEDSTVVESMNSCKQWLVDPQSWALDQAMKSLEGNICCPREGCEAIVGKWRWEGMSSVCGGNLAPAFVINKDAVCVLGNMTSQSTELMATASSEIPPQE